MSRGRKRVTAEDGSHIEVEGDIADVVSEPTAEDIAVYWTKKGEETGAFSEHGSHRAGDQVMTAYAGKLIEAGFATAEPPAPPAPEEGA